MKIFELLIMTILLVATVYGTNSVFAPPAAEYPNLKNIVSVFHVNPKIIHPNEIDAAQIEVQNNGNFALYDVQVHFWNDTTLALHRPDKIDTLQPHETKIIRGALSTSNITSGTRDLFWQIIAKNETGTIMESTLFQRPLTVEDISKSQEFNYCCRDLDSTSPLKQFKSGIAIKNIKCTDDLKLIIKKSNNSPVCVKPKSVPKLLLRGWAILSLKDFGYNPGRGPVTLQESSKNQNVTLTVDNSLRVCGALGLPCPLEPRFQAKQIDNSTYVVVIEINGKSYTVTLNDTATCVTPPVNGRPACFTEPEQITVNQTAQIIPSCMSHIENQYASAGPRGDPLCPVVNFGASSKILDATGFYGIYNYTAYPNTLNFVLEPGHNGTMTYLISVSWIHNMAYTPEYPNEINITNDVDFMHDVGMHNHPGVDISINPKSEMIEQNGSASVTMTFSASKDALHGTYWVRLPPGICAGGETIVLTITDCTK